MWTARPALFTHLGRYFPQHEPPQQPCPQQDPLQDEQPSAQQADPHDPHLASQQDWHAAEQPEAVREVVGAEEETPVNIAARTADLSVIESMMESPN
ncbi:MAG: hypothetical protein HRU75_05540 [Planctomycetia bacterium]|nr:MAG: hypothetical protein HRU75_05540 [Planctomycetia bacterium]